MQLQEVDCGYTFLRIGKPQKVKKVSDVGFAFQNDLVKHRESLHVGISETFTLPMVLWQKLNMQLFSAAMLQHLTQMS